MTIRLPSTDAVLNLALRLLVRQPRRLVNVQLLDRDVLLFSSTNVVLDVFTVETGIAWVCT